METMSYPCSPLIPFPTQHEESSYLLWSPQLVAPCKNADMYDGDPSPDDQQHDHEILSMMVQDANGLHQDDFSNVHVLAAGCEEIRLLGEEDGSLVAVQEELMEEDSLGDLLLAGAKAVEARDLIHASAIISKLDDILPDIAYRRYDHAAVSSLEHLACYFAQGLRSQITGARTECHPTAPPPANRLPAYQMLQELSPFIKFAHFTANQAILEATMGDQDVHVVDFNIGDGVQWSSLMSDLARHSSRSFHLTALTTGTGSDAGTHRTAARWLSEFAESLGLPFRYDSLHALGEEDLLEFTKSCKGGSVIVSCDTTNMSHTSLNKSQMLLLGSVKLLQPRLVILIEEELFRIGRKPSPANASFVEFFCESLHHFTAVLESLASCFCGGSYEICLRLVEVEILGPRIEDSAGRHGSMTGGAGNASGRYLEGFRACGMSSFNIAQAKMLVGLFSRGFGVVHDKGRLALCWKDKPLTSVSVWSPL